MTTLNDIEAACKAARTARDGVQQRAIMLHETIEQAKRKHLPGLKRAVEKAAEADAALIALLQAAPGLFSRPKSIVLHGLRVGYKKDAGTVVYDDAAQVTKLIRKHLPDQFDVLVKTKETPVKAAIRNLTGAELQRIGVRVNAPGEVVFIDDTTDGVDKLVAALLKGAEADAEAEEGEVTA